MPTNQRLSALAAVLCASFAAIQALGYWHTWLGLPTPAGIALSILLITAYLWISEALPLYISSLGVLAMGVLWLAPALQPGYQPESLYFAFFSDLTLLFLGGFTLSALLNKYGLAQRMASWLLARTGTAPDRVLLGLLLVSAFLSMWMSNTATAAMMFAIVTPMIAQLPQGHSFSKALAIGIPFACNIGGLGTPIGTPPNAIAMAYLAQQGWELSFAWWMAISLPIVALLLGGLWLLLLRLYPPGALQMEHQQAKQPNAPLSAKQWLIIGIFGFTVLGWLLGGQTGISTGMTGLLCVLLAYGSGLLKTPDFRNMPWDILFMLGGGLCLGSCLTASGLTAEAAGLIPAESSLALIFGTILLLSAGMTTVMSNTATANLLLPVAISLPASPLLLSIAIAFMCSSSMALPVSTPPNAIAFGSGLFKVGDMAKAGLVVTLMAMVLTSLASIFYIPLFI